MDTKQILVLCIVSLNFAFLVNGNSPSSCSQCMRSGECKPPDCFCCRDELNLAIPLAKTPQIVFFTFDDAVTEQVAGFYRDLFHPSRKNPNGCPISMTLFISHDNTKYGLVSDFHKRGMEIASHSVTHSTMNGSNFFEEAKAQRENLAKLANIPITDITGWRSPFLKPTGDLQPDALKQLGYEYDATLTFSKRSFAEKPPGPFTLDFGYPYECQVKPCPRHKHPGFWEVPVVSLMDYKQKYDCVYVDGCMNAPPDEESAYKFLWENFHSYYSRTKMPFGINMHPSWFFYPDRLKAMDRFIEKLVSLDDVYIISANKMLQWLKRPVPLQDLHSFAPWACDGRESSFNTGPSVVKVNLPPPPPIPWTQQNSFVRIANKPSMPLRTKPRVATGKSFHANAKKDVKNVSPKSVKTIRRVDNIRAPVPSAIVTALTESQAVPPPFSVRAGHIKPVKMNTQQQRISDEMRRQQLFNGRKVNKPHKIVKKPSTGRFPFVFSGDFVNSQAKPAGQAISSARPSAMQPYVERELKEEQILLKRRQKEMEEKLRQQRQLLQEQQRRLELEKQQLLLKRSQEMRLHNPDRNDRMQAKSKTQESILWRPASQSANIGAISVNAKTDGWAERPTQKSRMVWPLTSPITSRKSSRNVDTQTISSLNIPQRRTQFASREVPVSADMQRNVISPRHAWYMNNRHSRNGPRLTRGGSNRRTGTLDRQSIPNRFNSVETNTHHQNSNQLNRAGNFVQIPWGSARERVQNAFNIRHNQGKGSPTEQSSHGRRNLQSTQAQNTSWSNFLRQMVGAS